MKKSLFALLPLIPLLACPRSALAKVESPFKWRGSEYVLDVEADRHLAPRLKANVAVHAHAWPNGEDAYGFLMAGAKWRANPHLTLIPRLGLFHRWHEKEEESLALLASAVYIDLADHRLSLLVESNHVLGSGVYRHNGYCSLNLKAIEYLGSGSFSLFINGAKTPVPKRYSDAVVKFKPVAIDIGLHSEHWNLVSVFGPHIAVYRPDGFWRVEVQYHVGLHHENYGGYFRTVVTLSF